MKKIDFKPFETHSYYGTKMRVREHDDREIVVEIYTYSDAEQYGGCFRDPAKLRELSAQIAKAADALEAAQRLTFADLEPGEWFRWAQHAEDGRYALRKVDGNTIINPENWNTNNIRQHDVLVRGAFAGSAVVRVAATFTPEAQKP